MTNGNGKARLTDITDAQRRSLAKRHLSGHMLTDMEGFAGLDLPQLRKLFRQEKTQAILREEQAHLDTTAVRIRNRMSYGIEDSVDRMKARGAGLDGPQIAYKADEFLITNLLPKVERHISEQDVTFRLDAQVAIQINDAIDVLKEITERSTGPSQSLSQFTLLGTEGIATAEPSEATQEIVVEDSSDPGPTITPRPFTEPEDGSGEPDPPAQP